MRWRLVPLGMVNCPRRDNSMAANIGPDTEVWILIRLCDAEIGARRVDPRNRIPEIVILRQRRADQFLELLVLENFEPFKLGNGLLCREVSQQKRRGMHPALSRQAAGNPGRPCSRSEAPSTLSSPHRRAFSSPDVESSLPPSSHFRRGLLCCRLMLLPAARESLYRVERNRNE